MMNRREFNRILASSATGLLATDITHGNRPTSQAADKYTINADRLRKSLESLSEYGRNPEGGVSRVAWTEPDIQARRFVIDKLMSGIGLDIRIDAAGSIYGRREGTEKNLPVILFGSHIDSVPKGGNFDGDVGSMSAIEIMRTLYEKKIATRHPLECVIWSNEEGVHYGRGLFGSRAVVGEFEPGELDEKDEAGLHIRDAVRSVGGDLARIEEARRKQGEIAAYIELHIEQGGLLDKAGIPIGVVEGIVGINRYDVKITGFANHAGTTPMPDRRDALVAASNLVISVREETMREPGRQVGTVGKLAVKPGAPNVIPGEVDLVIELRDLSLEKVEAIFSRIEKRAAEIARRTETKIDFKQTSSHKPALATPWVRDLIAKEAAGAGFKTMSLPSGAGHDAQMLARIAPMGMIFVPSAGGISHSPRELTEWQDAANGCEVLLRTVLAIDKQR
ncbi:MAG TPA: Zn-dependent hydrolase [Blastocatellia bacterium]|nr:Zn-dependent hydrolase [Blastocatellia bacterium]